MHILTLSIHFHITSHIQRLCCQGYIAAGLGMVTSTEQYISLTATHHVAGKGRYTNWQEIPPSSGDLWYGRVVQAMKDLWERERN